MVLQKLCVSESIVKMPKATSYKVSAASAESNSNNAPAELVWFGQAVHFREFADNYPIPNLVKIVQGEYMNLAAKHGGPEDDGKENELLIYSVETTTKALGVNLRVKDGRGVIQTENKVSIPLSYEGWFEVLSEDGRRVRPIETIKDLAKIFPHTCLVRKDIEALVAMPDGSVKLDSQRTVSVGETLTLFGLMQFDFGSGNAKYLRCLDAKGNSLYFQQDQTGMFSPVAGKENISGVHTIKGILNKFHLPVTCKLVHGTYPKNVDKNKFSGIMRLVYVYDEQHAFVCPASGHYRMIPIPSEVQMKVVPAVNFDEIRQTAIISRVLDRCQNMVRCFQNSIHLLYDVDVLPTPKPITPAAPAPVQEEEPKEKDPEKNNLYDEIEDIYFYVVRHGVAPPAIPKRLYKEGEQDNDFWDQPIYKTLHKQRQRQSIVDLTNAANDENKLFRFHHEDDNQARPLAYVRSGNKVDQAVELTQVPPKSRLMTRRLSEQGIAQVPDPKGTGKKERRRSQPAIFRFLFRGKDDRDSGGASKGSGDSEGSGGKPAPKLKNKMKNMYL